jgi:sterol desaturase/sphingolipid hydroxylase (fatty acid hydroxylase superfamily)
VNELLAILITAATSLVWLCVMFAPLERMFPANREQPFFRPGFWTDLLFFAGQYFLFSSIAVSVITVLAEPIESVAWLTPTREWFAAKPTWLQVVLVLMGGDLFAYWGHRAQHRFSFLWRFHAVHHSNTHIDWLGAHREHPLDGLYTQTLVNIPALLLGFGLGELLGVIAFRSVWAIFIHSNVRLPLGPLKYFVGSPALHHWHHAKDRAVGNYANLGPWLDVLFGTFYLPDGEPEEMGLDEPLATTYWGLLFKPLTRSPFKKESDRVI